MIKMLSVRLEEENHVVVSAVDLLNVYEATMDDQAKIIGHVVGPLDVKDAE